MALRTAPYEKCRMLLPHFEQIHWPSIRGTTQARQHVAFHRASWAFAEEKIAVRGIVADNAARFSTPINYVARACHLPMLHFSVVFVAKRVEQRCDLRDRHGLGPRNL